MVIASTKHLIIREFVPEDIDALYSIYEDNCDYIEPLSKNREEERQKLKAYIKYVYGFYGFGLWAVVEKESGSLVGRCGLSVEEIDGQGELEIGYMIGRPWQHKGYGLESVRAVLNYAWEETAEVRVAARIDALNKASKALAKKAGFVQAKTTSNQGRETELYFYEIPERSWDTM